MSPLRIVGCLVAIGLGAFLLRSFARRAPTPADGLGLLTALLLLVVSLFPSVMNLPTLILRLGARPHGRLIALLVLSNLALWCYLVWTSEQRRRTNERWNHILESLFARLESVEPPPRMGELAIVIPAYNEEESIAEVLREIPSTVEGLRVTPIVVSDGSVDRTAEVARQHGAVVLELPINQGGGAAIRVGYHYAARAGAEIVVTMDADGQHQPADLPQLVAPILEDRADFVIGSRHLGSYEKVTSLRSFGLGFFNVLLNLLLATELTDCSSGYRAFSVRRLPRLTTTESQYHTAETIMEVRRLGLRIAEVPITVRRRIAGTSRKGHDLVYGYRFARVMLSKWIRG